MNQNQPETETKTISPNNKMTLSFDLRFIVVGLLIIIGVMLLAWQPWLNKDPEAKNRTVTVTGETTIKAVPDEFVFSPAYDFKDKDKAKALADLTAKSDEVVKRLKTLGIAGDKIKTNSDGYNYDYYYSPDNSQNTYSLRLTVTASDKKMAQKVQDYLVTTSPSGNISPRANFSDKKRKNLENEARDEASKDARAKAERTAKGLGFSLGKVKSISDSNGGGGPIMLDYKSTELSVGGASDQPNLAVQPGENDLPYSMTVIYFVE